MWKNRLVTLLKIVSIFLLAGALLAGFIIFAASILYVTVKALLILLYALTV